MITFSNVAKSYFSNKVLENINLEIKEGETFCLLGKSGSGKTTLLKMINKLVYPDEGSITLDGKNIATIDDIRLRKKIGYVIQSGGLFPHMKIKDNITLPMHLAKIGKTAIKERLLELLDQIGLDSSFMDRYPSTLSGGQQQRVGIARAIANKPKILLMDEPFSALDPVLREQMQDDFLNMEALNQITKVIVTHDIDEALKLGHRIGLIDNGKAIFIGTPKDFLQSEEHKVIDYVGGKAKIFQVKQIRLKDLEDIKPIANEGDVERDCAFVTDETQLFSIAFDQKKFIKNTKNNAYYRTTEVKNQLIAHIEKIL